MAVLRTSFTPVCSLPAPNVIFSCGFNRLIFVLIMHFAEIQFYGVWLPGVTSYHTVVI